MLREIVLRFKIRRLRRMLRGHRLLKNMNSLDKICSIKNALATSNCIESDFFSETIFGVAASNGELVVRQYILYHFVSLNFHRAVLYAFGKSESAVVYAIPPMWNDIFEPFGLRVAKIRSMLLWNCFMLVFLAQGFRVIGNTIFQGIKEIIKPTYNGLNRYTYFDNLNINNIPKANNQNLSHDIVTWYLRWNGRVAELNSICHDIKGLSSTSIGTVEITDLPSAIPPINSVYGLIQYSAWAVKASLLAMIDLFRGRWWHALLLNQAAKAAHVRTMSDDILAREYMFHNSNWIYRPLWTYEAEKKGSLVTFYFYSTNCEDFKRQDGYPCSVYGWQNMNWPRYLVWDKWQADFIYRNTNDNSNALVVGPIWFDISNNMMTPEIKNKTITVFDVTPFRSSMFNLLSVDFEYYVPHNCIEFLKDIQQVADEFGYSVIWKRKRNIGSIAHPKYRKFSKVLNKSENIINVDPDLSAYTLIEASTLVISMPFTSTALIARELNIPSIYYDPFGMCQKDDRASHGIDMLIGKKELREWLSAQK